MKEKKSYNRLIEEILAEEEISRWNTKVPYYIKLEYHDPAKRSLRMTTDKEGKKIFRKIMADFTAVYNWMAKPQDDKYFEIFVSDIDL